MTNTPLIQLNHDWSGAFPRLGRPLRLGVVGGGRISQVQAMAARQSGYWEVVAGALSSNAEKAIGRGKEWYLPGDRCYTDFTRMAQQEATREDGIEAVMVTTPNHLHFAAAREFLQNGIDVICDKPLTNELQEAQELIAICNKNNRIFAVCYVMSCFPMVRQARELVQSGAIGEINQIHVEFMQDWMLPNNPATPEHVQWRLDPARSGKTSCVGDIGTHAAHISSFVSGLELTDLYAMFHICGTPKPLEDTAFMLTKYNKKIPGTLLATRLASGNRGGLRLRVYGSKGGVEWELESSESLKVNIYGQPDQIISRGQGHGVSPAVERLVRTARGFPEGLIEAWTNLYTEVAIEIAARQSGIDLPENLLLYPKLEEGVAGVQFIEKSVQSQGTGRWVEI